MNPAEPDPRPVGLSPPPLWRQLVAPIIAVGLLIAVGQVLGSRWPVIEAAIIGWGVWGWVLYLAACLLLIPFSFPVAAMSLSAGALFGPWLGLLLVETGSLLAAVLIWVLARGMLRARVQRLVTGRPRLAALDRMAGERAIRLNLLTRLSPLNFGIASFTLAAGRSGPRAYFLGTLGAVPGMSVYVWLGWLARRSGDLASSMPTRAKIALLAGGIIVFMILGWILARMIRQAWLGAADGDSPGPHA